jgi:DNA-directed RNA polymerase subunit F
MTTVIFQVSRFVEKSPKTGYSQLRLKERYNSDSVTALATLHLQEDSNPWLQGMHYAVVDNGEAYYGFDKEDPDQRVDYNINFTTSQLSQLRTQILSLGSKLTSPSKDDNGVSELMGVQLHVKLHEGVEVKIATVEPKTKAAAKWGTKFKISVSPAEIELVSLVQYGEPTYLEAPGDRMSISLLTQALYKKSKVVQAKPTTVDEVKSVLTNLKAKARGANRHASNAEKAARQAGKAATAMTPQEETVKVSRVLVDDEDDQPE